MKNRNAVSFQIISPKLCQKVNKHLIIARAVHLINHQHNRAQTDSAQLTQTLKEFAQSTLRIFFHKIMQYLQKSVFILCLCKLECARQLLCKSLGEKNIIRKLCHFNFLKI